MRSAFSEIVLFLALFGGGGASGYFAAGALAPGSELAAFVGLVMLPVGFALGISAWQGLVVLIVVPRFLWGLIRNRRERDLRRAAEASLKQFRNTRPPGAWVFVPVCFGVAAAAGLLMALSPAAQAKIVTVAACAFLGLVYGAILWRLARSGRLPMPVE